MNERVLSESLVEIVFGCHAVKLRVLHRWNEIVLPAKVHTSCHRILGPNLHNFVKWTFVILSQFFPMSADKLSYEKFTKELPKNYDKHTIDWRVTTKLRRVYETICNSRNIFASAFYKFCKLGPRAVSAVTTALWPNLDNFVKWTYENVTKKSDVRKRTKKLQKKRTIAYKLTYKRHAKELRCFVGSSYKVL